MAECKQSTELKKECPYCGKDVNAKGLNLHVRNSSGEPHGDFGEVPEGFDASEIETVEKPSERFSNSEDRGTLNKRLYLCNYCNELCKGKRGLSIHLSKSRGDVLHSDGVEVSDERYTLVPADDDWNSIMDLEDVYKTQNQRRVRGEIGKDTPAQQVVEGDEKANQIANLLIVRPELKTQRERVKSLFNATDEELDEGINRMESRL